MRHIIFGAFTLLSTSAFCAEGVKITGSMVQTIPPAEKAKYSGFQRMATAPLKKIKLLKIDLSQEKKQQLRRNVSRLSVVASPTPYANQTTNNANLPSHRQLGMGAVPVLDQGMHGSCVTFASSAALSAAMNQGDVISELCQLQLGNYLEEYGFAPSGWDGSFGPIVLSQMERFGFVSKKNQATFGCGGYTAYPMNDADPYTNISVEDFHRISTPIPEDITWSPVLNVMDAFEDFGNSNALQKVKASLNKGDRLTFGVLLFNFDQGTVGAIGSHNAINDTWVLTPEFRRDLQNYPDFGGHEMIISGYDDNATAKDDKGRLHKGLLTLRNSWGAHAGDKGNFYMSYDYFSTLVMEVQRIRVDKDDDF